MATETVYTYSIATDFHGSINISNLTSEIRTSTISIALDYISTNNDVVSVYFKDVLGSADLATLATVISTSNTAPSAPVAQPVTITASATTDANNSSSVNLAGGATFTGSSSSTTGASAIQVTLKADQPCTVYVDQSPDGANWNVTDTFNYYTASPFGISIQVVCSYERIRVTNVSASSTTLFNLQTSLCPSTSVVPRSLDANGNLRTSTQAIQDVLGFPMYGTPNGESRTIVPTLLAGAQFEMNGNAVAPAAGSPDPTFWNTAVDASSGPGTILQKNSEVTLSSGTTATSFSALWSFRRARYVSGYPMRLRTNIAVPAGTAGNTRRWGVAWTASMPSTPGLPQTNGVTDGLWFQASGTNSNVVVSKCGTQTIIGPGGTSGYTSFNGQLGSGYAFSVSNATYEIYWNNSSVYFIVDGTLLHKFSAMTHTLTTTLMFYVYMDNFNTAVQGTAAAMYVRNAAIHRLGPIEVSPVWKNIHGANVGAILKYGPGKLHNVTMNSFTSVTTCSLYDSISASNPIASITPSMAGIGATLHYNLEFYNGLYVVTTDSSADLTIVFE
jgi:hypothetical protein